MASYRVLLALSIVSALLSHSVLGQDGDCGCAASMDVCGSNYKTFPSSCHATCHFAAPSTAGGCDSCAQACTGRVGLMADTTFQATCNKDLSKQFCSYPSWPLGSSDYATTGDPCSYMLGACTRGCTESKRAARNKTHFSGCMTNCLCSPRTTCSADLFPDYCAPVVAVNSTTNGTEGNSTTSGTGDSGNSTTVPIQV